MAKELMIGNIKVERTDKGDRVLTHPSSVKVTETAKILAERRLALQNAIIDAEANLQAFDAQAAKEAVLTPIASVIGG